MQHLFPISHNLRRSLPALLTTCLSPSEATALPLCCLSCVNLINGLCASLLYSRSLFLPFRLHCRYSGILCLSTAEVRSGRLLQTLLPSAPQPLYLPVHLPASWLHHSASGVTDCLLSASCRSASVSPAYCLAVSSAVLQRPSVPVLRLSLTVWPSPPTKPHYWPLTAFDQSVLWLPLFLCYCVRILSTCSARTCVSVRYLSSQEADFFGFPSSSACLLSGFLCPFGCIIDCLNSSLK